MPRTAIGCLLLLVVAGCADMDDQPVPVDGAEPAPPGPKTDTVENLVDIAGHPAETEIRALFEQGIVAGFPGGYFYPDAGLTRAQYAAVIERAFLAGSDLPASSWPDVPRDHWGHDPISRSGATGFLRGYDDGTMRPDAAMTRQELYAGAVAGLRHLDVPLPDSDTDYLARFADGDQLSSWAKEQSASAHFYGLLDSPLLAGDRLQPHRAVTRAEAVTVIHRARNAHLRSALGVYAGPPGFGDFAEGVIVAGPATDTEVVLACTRGTVYVAAGAATGALAAMLTSAGVVSFGSTTAASIPVWATAGGLIGWAGSIADWGTCIPAMGRVVWSGLRNGYFAIARGTQEVIRRVVQAVSGGRTCNPNSNDYCRNVYRTYKQYCTQQQFQNLGCNTLSSCEPMRDMAIRAALCHAGRAAYTDKCASPEPGHDQATRHAENVFDQCMDKYVAPFRGCADASTPGFVDDLWNTIMDIGDDLYGC